MAKLIELVQLPARRSTFTVLGSALLVSAVCWYFGADFWAALALGGVITILWMAVLVASSHDPRDFDWRGSDRSRGRGSRSEVSNLSYRYRAGWGRVDRSIQRRMRDIARHRLALSGLDLDETKDGERIQQLIGSSAYVLLVGDHKRTLSRRAVNRCLDALDAIDPNYYRSVSPQPASRFPFSTLERQRNARDR